MGSKAFAANDAEWCYHGGELQKLGDVRLSPATHALNYGTGVFEGIRAYWSDERGTLQVLKLREHYERFDKSCRLLRLDLPHTVDELCDVTLEILRRNAPREDTYIRPLAYKAAESVGVNLKGRSELSIFTVPMGNYVELTGLKCCVSSWRRTPDNAIPARAKCTGSYVNTALAGDQAHRAGHGGPLPRRRPQPRARRGPGPQGRLRRRHLPHPGRAGLGGERREHIPRPQGRAHHAARHGGHSRGHNARRRHGARGEGARDSGRRARGGPDGALRRGRGLPLWHGLPDRARHGGRPPPPPHAHHP